MSAMVRYDERCRLVPTSLVFCLQLFVLCCQSNPLDSENGERRRPTQGTESGGLRLTMDVPDEIRQGEVIEFGPAVTNLGDDPLAIEVPGGPLFEVYLTSEDGAVVWNNLHGGFVPLPVTILTLGPGERASGTVEWDQRGNDGSRVQPGDYLVFATFWLNFEPDLKTESRPMRIVE